MKNLRFLLALVIGMISVLILSAEYTYKPMLEDGKKWVIGYCKSISRDTILVQSIRTLEIAGDTTVNGHHGKVFACPWENCISYEEGCIVYDNFYTSECRDHFYGSARHDNSNASERHDDFLPLLNFNVQVGDTIEAYVIDSEKIVEIRGIERRVLFLRRNDLFVDPNCHKPLRSDYILNQYSPDCWIEGIGAIHQSYLSSYTRVLDGGCRIISEVYKNDELLYRAGDLEEMLGIENTVLTDYPKQDSSIYDLFGQKIENPKKGQIYIRGGKKIIW